MDSSKISNELYDNIELINDMILAGETKKNKEIAFVKKELNIQKNDKILDICCGYGRLSLGFAEECIHVHGIDISEKMITKAKENMNSSKNKIEYRVGNMLQLPYSPCNFNKVICFWSSFNHLLSMEEQVKALNQMYSVLSNEGIALIELLNGDRKIFSQLLNIHNCDQNNDNRILTLPILNKYNATIYIHNKETLLKIFQNSKFKKFKIKLVNISGRKKLVGLLYKKSPESIDEEEKKLLKKINVPFSKKKNLRFHLLITKRGTKNLSSAEYAELLALTEAFEEYELKRLNFLVKLADLKKISLPEVINLYNLHPSANS